MKASRALDLSNSVSSFAKMLRFVAGMVAFVLALAHGAASGVGHVLVHVTLSSAFPTPVSGRLLVLVAKGTSHDRLEIGRTNTETWIAAREVAALSPETGIDIDADEIAWPAGFSLLPPGDYQMQAFLDQDHSYAYNGLGSGDLSTEVRALRHWDAAVSDRISLSLEHEVPATAEPMLRPGIERIAFRSPSLTAFWGRPIDLTGFVVLPPSYEGRPNARYSTVYWTHGFGGTLRTIAARAEMYQQLMVAHEVPEMIWVVLNQSFATGTVEFVDSINNGPWGFALTRELMPYLERHYRMHAAQNGRFLTGHSSGGWATLWLQVAYPTIFGGTWSTAPDPPDFRNFTGVDIYAPNANAYMKPDGAQRMLIRLDGRDVFSLRDYAKREAVTGEYGGQFSSFDWVFSPRGDDGRPMPLFNRATGVVNADVARYWGEHFDITRKVTREWTINGKDLRGKIHVIVGTADTFHLEEPIRLLEDALQQLDARAMFTYVPGRNHSDLYGEGGDRQALTKRIAKDMDAVAHGRK